MANVSKIMKASYAAERSRRAKWKRVRFKDNRLPETISPAISVGGCWCGEPYNHEWEGKDQGKPHPVTSGKGMIRVPPHVLRREATLALQEAGVCPFCRGYPIIRQNPVSGEDEPWCAVCLGTGGFPPPQHLDTAAASQREQKLHELQDQDRDLPEAGTFWVPEAPATEEESVTKTETKVKNAAANLADALVNLPDNWIVCRDMRHAWEIDKDFHVLTTTRSGAQIGRVLKCMRCQTRRQEQYLTRNGYGLEKLRQSYLYPEGYQISGVPRGTKPQSIVQQEQYRRAMERAALLARRTSTLPQT